MGYAERTKKKVGMFDVLKKMIELELDVRLSPLSNTRRIELVKGGTLVTIGMEGDVMFRLHNGMFIGGLLLVDKTQYLQVQAEMEAVRNPH